MLAGAILALRLLPPVTRLGERFVDGHPWTATMLGMWQAGRRPHAGPVLLLALAVAAATLAWCLAGTAERSLYDQADHGAGADLRLVETSGFPPARRVNQLAGLPGVTAVLPGLRDALRLGPRAEPADVLAVDAAHAAGVLRLRDDLARPGLLERLAAARASSPATPLGESARHLSGTISVFLDGATPYPVDSHAVLMDNTGLTYRVALGTTTADGTALRFRAELPETAGHALSLIGFDVSTVTTSSREYRWQVSDLAVQGADGSATVPLDDSGGWQVVDDSGQDGGTPAQATGRTLTGRYQMPELSERFFYAGGVQLRFSLIRPAPEKPVPAVATPQALAALRISVGGTTPLNLASGQVNVKVIESIKAVPGAGTPAALLIDLPSLGTALYAQSRTAVPQEWWLTTDPRRHTETAAAAARLDGLEVIDRVAAAAAAGRDPYGMGARTALFAAAFGAMLLALVGLAVDARATARRRVGELAVLHTLGAGPRLLARSLIAEQTVLAGLGVTVGLLVGIGVAATMAPLVILTPAAGRPVPEPLLRIAWVPAVATAAGVLIAALGMSALLARTVRQQVVATQLRIGGEQ